MNVNQIDDIKRAAMGRWKEIFLALAPQLQTAMEKAGHHVPCPVHGGVDGFRLFPQYEIKGDGICNTCGPRTDGFAMLMWLNEWTFTQAAEQVASVLGLRKISVSNIQPPAKEEEHTGCIKVMQKAHYQHNPKNPMSYTVVLQLEDRKVITLWGADLEKALESIQAQAGDWVTIKRLGKREVKINDRSYNKVVWSAHLSDSPEQKLARQQAEKHKQEKEAKVKREAIQTVWDQSEKMASNSAAVKAVKRYLVRRFIANALSKGMDSVRVHPALTYTDGKEVIGRYPALVCQVTDPDGNVVSLHRTYLTEKGFKAKVASPKKLMPVPNGSTINGAAIRLSPVKPIIGIAEGIETALSVMRLKGIACWSVICANGMRTFKVPQGVKEVHIYADKDESGEGERAARDLCERLQKEGYKAWVHLPEMDIPEGAKGVDFNDVLAKRYNR